MESISIGDYHFLIFVIPGVITVWSFRYFTKSTKIGDFEFLGLSFFWGLIMLAFYELIASRELVEQLLRNPYAAALVLPVFGIMFGWVGSWISKWKLFRKIIKFLGRQEN